MLTNVASTPTIARVPVRNGARRSPSPENMTRLTGKAWLTEKAVTLMQPYFNLQRFMSS